MHPLVGDFPYTKLPWSRILGNSRRSVLKKKRKSIKNIDLKLDK